MWGIIICIASYLVLIVPQKQIANINIKKEGPDTESCGTPYLTSV